MCCSPRGQVFRPLSDVSGGTALGGEGDRIRLLANLFPVCSIVFSEALGAFGVPVLPGAATLRLGFLGLGGRGGGIALSSCDLAEILADLTEL